MSSGVTDSYTFAGKTATIRFADFSGLANGYGAGAHRPGDVLRFTASVGTAAGYTASAAATAQVIAGGLNVTVTPVKSVIYPYINSSRRSKFSGQYSTPVEIKVTDAGNQAVAGALVDVSARMASGSGTFGGHDHGARDGSGKPVGRLAPGTGVTDDKGMFFTTYHATEFSGRDEITATASYNGCTGISAPATITAEVPNLIPVTLPAGSPHQFVGGRCEHLGGYTPWNPGKTAACGGATGASNRYISKAIKKTFDDFLNEYALLHGGAGLYFNDASLPKGGKFDVNGGWCTACSHSTHRIGVDVDFALKDSSAPVTGLPTDFPVVWERILAANRNAKKVYVKDPQTGKVKTIKIITPKISYQQHSVGTPNAHVHIFFIQ
ncbi:MAG: hypothetical protein R8K47_08230 [Mariprofundaceae bacterium]